MYVRCQTPKHFKRNMIEEGKKIYDISNNFGNLFVTQKDIISNTVQKYILSKPDSDESRLIKNFVLDAVITSEKISATGGEVCLNMSSIMMKSLQKIADAEKISKSIMSGSKRLERSDLENLVNHIFEDNCIQKDLVLELFDSINFTYPIFIERTNHVDTSISISNGFNFKLKVNPEYLKSGKWNRSNVKCFVIDGFIESVGEIHHLLEKATSEKDPIIIFARNFSQDVETTILYNFKRGTLDILPVSVGFDENTLNILNDISICTGSDLISSLKGDLISKSTQGDAVLIDSVSASENDITLSKKEESPLLRSHIRYLTDKRDNSSSSSDLFDIFNRRIRSMISGKAEVKIGTDLYHKDPQVIEKLDLVMRIFRSYIESGVIYKRSFSGVCDILDDSTVENFPYPAASIILSAKNANSLISSLTSIGHIIYADT